MGRGGGLEWDAFGSLTNDTIDGNSATGGSFGLGDPVGTAASGSGGGAALFGGTTLANTIVAQNTATGGSPTAPDCGPTARTAGHNLIGAIDECNGIVSGSNGDLAGTSLSPLDPQLASLASNGGGSQTMAEKPGSPAIGHGSATTCTSSLIADKDQRGYPRLSENRGTCDTGAYDSAEPERLAISAPSSVADGTTLSLTVTAVDPFGNPVTSFRDKVRFASNDKAAALPTDYTFTAADNGVHTFTVTLTTPGSRTVSVTDKLSALIKGTSDTITVT